MFWECEIEKFQKPTEFEPAPASSAFGGRILTLLRYRTKKIKIKQKTD